mmetsp:Transcript_22746/g.74040  ORF Transcript_22746/g.74040 Transcript_22746/m.74040 type:complete len:299 (-) Transcript_22746:1920-2816(-)
MGIRSGVVVTGRKATRSCCEKRARRLATASRITRCSARVSLSRTWRTRCSSRSQPSTKIGTRQDSSLAPRAETCPRLHRCTAESLSASGASSTERTSPRARATPFATSSRRCFSRGPSSGGSASAAAIRPPSRQTSRTWPCSIPSSPRAPRARWTICGSSRPLARTSSPSSKKGGLCGTSRSRRVAEAAPRACAPPPLSAGMARRRCSRSRVRSCNPGRRRSRRSSASASPALASRESLARARAASPRSIRTQARPKPWAPFPSPLSRSQPRSSTARSRSSSSNPINPSDCVAAQTSA